MSLKRSLLFSLVVALTAACSDAGPRAASPDAGLPSGSGGSGWYTQCLCEADMQAYLDLSFVELADTVTGTITTRQDSVILRLDSVHWAPSKTLPFPLTEGSTISIYQGAGDRRDFAADFAPWGSIGRMGRHVIAPFRWNALHELVSGERFFGMLSRPTGPAFELKIAALKPSGDPVCDPFALGPHQPEVQVTRAELIAILESHATWQDASLACVRKLEETGGWSGALGDPPPADAGP